MFNYIEIAIVDGFVDQSETAYFEDHKRGRNWIAHVSFHPAANGGLNRAFWERGSGSWVQVPEVSPGDVVEIGSDYITGGGHRSPKRGYYVICDVRPDAIVIVECEKPDAKNQNQSRDLLTTYKLQGGNSTYGGNPEILRRVSELRQLVIAERGKWQSAGAQEAIDDALEHLRQFVTHAVVHISDEEALGHLDLARELGAIE